MIRKFISSQFRKPRGLFGLLVAKMMAKGNDKNYMELLRNVDYQSNATVLEIGYGPGTGIGMMAGASDTCTIEGIDFSKLMYKKASVYNKQYIESGRVHLQHGNFLDIPLKGKYDIVICLNVVYFWNNLGIPFIKIYSILNSRGALHLYMADKSTVQRLNPNDIFNKYEIDQVLQVLKASGFTDVQQYFNKGYYIMASKI
jgi:SAM-dependent methyltransferase